uniref:NADH dehydrogenase subunit 2 n=1 Tax=Nudaurelia wahlbergi TaxID=2909405 RepID=UPI001F147155|nr:NADH dehydrogenase subunit 2 [Nudaurelia wahlbergi]ULO26153.1 NADH dehydrogenase subunit 2 [Nudaurelia wahlbergi]
MYYFNNSNKMFFSFILFLSTLISISSNSWFGCWIGLEINLLSFIPLISSPNNLLTSEASLKYFLTQSIGSINFLFIILFKMMMMKNFYLNNIFSIMINSSLLMKMGSIPFHFWFPIISEGLSWINNFTLMTWQKISPIILLSYYFNKNFLYFVIIFNIIISTISGFNQTSLRKLMVFSSINNLGWMILTIMISENLWIFYFLLYSFLISILCIFFFNLNMFFINQLFINNTPPMIKINLLINFLSLGGLPPFLGFLPKWITINFLMFNNFMLMTLLLIMFSLIILFFYIRLTYSCFMFNYIKMKWFKINLKNKFLWMLNFFSLISISSSIISTFLFF